MDGGREADEGRGDAGCKEGMKGAGGRTGENIKANMPKY